MTGMAGVHVESVVGGERVGLGDHPIPHRHGDRAVFGESHLAAWKPAPRVSARSRASVVAIDIVSSESIVSSTARNAS
ncbi:hypothetical protein UA75_22120 [Actinoalloteichus sp. GBA129-24]|uniref:Uncharacterized protein n=1 Tax=Actinoalloteichus fjordicus TaxID=1612552 RepID=A0AAC9LET3_9PSEU|nr:hypothetical protein UA74_21645 [Actinoalloteichus fjordicus]APU22410.1 hypothetical protein UA75_22120 [Actinoalloteichus sp. GBA129-24]